LRSGGKEVEQAGPLIEFAEESVGKMHFTMGYFIIQARKPSLQAARRVSRECAAGFV